MEHEGIRNETRQPLCNCKTNRSYIFLLTIVVLLILFSEIFLSLFIYILRTEIRNESESYKEKYDQVIKELSLLKTKIPEFVEGTQKPNEKVEINENLRKTRQAYLQSSYSYEENSSFPNMMDWRRKPENEPPKNSGSDHFYGHPGIPGRPGSPGRPGNPGIPGRPGLPGVRGPPGPRGPPGYMSRRPNPDEYSDGDGLPGPPGPPGIPGPPGAPGIAEPSSCQDSCLDGRPGPIGPPGYPGIAGAPGLPGAPGTHCMCEKENDGPYEENPSYPYNYNRYSSPFDRQSCICKGSAGEPGPEGKPGSKGDRGVKGEKGDIGLLGIPGSDGEKGEPGSKGDPGFPGPLGEKGRAGENGVKGEKGDKGEFILLLKQTPSPLPRKPEMKGESVGSFPNGIPPPPSSNGEKGKHKQIMPEMKGEIEIGERRMKGPIFTKTENEDPTFGRGNDEITKGRSGTGFIPLTKR